MTDFLYCMISESAVRDKWPLDSMSEINYHGEIMPRPKIEPATPGLQIWCSPFWANRAKLCTKICVHVCIITDCFFSWLNRSFNLLLLRIYIFSSRSVWYSTVQFPLIGKYSEVPIIRPPMVFVKKCFNSVQVIFALKKNAFWYRNKWS